MKQKKILGTGLVLFGLATGAQAADYHVTVTNLTYGIHFTPLIVAAHDPSVSMFSSGTAASAQLQAIAEGGDVSAMAALLESVGAGFATGDGLVIPGGSAAFTVSGSAGDVLSLAGMLLPTNDGFVGLSSVHLPEGTKPYTYYAVGYDAGTEANDELVGSGAPGEAGFPAPPPIVASGTGVGGTGVHAGIEGFVHVHRNVIGDLDSTGGVSDINAAVHRWLNPVARVTVTRMGGSDGGGSADAGVSEVTGLSGVAYSRSAVEIFWGPASSRDSHITGYEVRRDGELLTSREGTSYFEEGLDAGRDYVYSVTAVDGNGNRGNAASVTVRTNAE